MALARGGRVRIEGLQARPELNGQEGTLVRFIESSERWQVKLNDSSDGSTLSLRPANLQCLVATGGNTEGCDEDEAARADGADLRSRAVALGAGSRVRLAGLKARQELNGRFGLALSFDLAKSRWRVALQGLPHESYILLKADNLEVLPHRILLAKIAGKGMGVQAVADIERGELVLAEKPALTLSRWEMMAPDEDVLLDKVRQLEVQEQTDFWSLHDFKQRDGAKSARGIFDTNAIACGESTCRDTVNGMFLLGSRFNHSCRPNVNRVWKQSLGLELFHAAIDIPQGTELCIYYQDVRDSRRERQAELERAFRFTCACEVCSLTGRAQAASDKLRAELRRLDGEIVDGTQSPENALIKVNRALDIVREELGGDPVWSKRAYYDGFQWALGAGNIKLAKSFMNSAIESMIAGEGDYPDEQLSTWRKWAVDPLLKLAGSAPAS